MHVLKTEIHGAYTELIMSIQNDLYKVAKARLDVEDDICDAIQETMIKSYQNIKKLKEDKYFKTWVIKILINECNQIYKKKYKQITIFNKSVEKAESTNSHDDIIDIDNKMDFERVLQSLSYEDRLLITLFYNSQFSIKEISELMNFNANTVKSKLLRVKKKIKEIYKEVAGNE